MAVRCDGVFSGLDARARNGKDMRREGPPLTVTVFLTVRGWVAIAAGETGLAGVSLPEFGAEEALTALAGELGRRPGPSRPLNILPFVPLVGTGTAGTNGSTGLVGSHVVSLLGEARAALAAYWQGREVVFRLPLDLDGLTPFQQAVLQATRRIPRGEVRTYRWVAAQVGKPRAFRAVGQALGRNPFPVMVPCHRVVACGADLGGFAGGIDLKAEMLRLEGCRSTEGQLSVRR